MRHNKAVAGQTGDAGGATRARRGCGEVKCGTPLPRWYSLLLASWVPMRENFI
jgi:hypothetical protein